ncbi:TniQ family protein [Deinococcus oregonensis]|uniref:TniQ family protein n=1 Tax=Deinococcus oregonensis TaxID=1805970 RepID=A0ABV6AZT6_9DEIO
MVGESFPSLILRYAASLGISVLQFLRITGFTPLQVGAPRSSLDFFFQNIPKLEYFSALTRLEVTQLTPLFFDKWFGVVLNPPNPNLDIIVRFRALMMQEWIYPGSSHVCPECVAQDGGAWQLHWKLPWSFACRRHAVMLLDYCPTCHLRFGRFVTSRSGNFNGDSPPDPLICGNLNEAHLHSLREPQDRRCPQLLADLPVQRISAFPEILSAQQQIDMALAGTPQFIAGRQVSAGEYFQALKTVVALLRYAWMDSEVAGHTGFLQDSVSDMISRRDTQLRANLESGGIKTKDLEARSRAPQNANLMAALTIQAQAMLAPKSFTELSDHLSPLFEQAHRRSSSMMQYVKGSDYVTQAFLNWRAAGIKPGKMNLKTQVIGIEGHPYNFTSDHIPQVFWVSEYKELFHELLEPFISSNRDFISGRRFCSLTLVRLSHNCTWREAGRKLGLPSSADAYASDVIASLSSAGRIGEFESRLHCMAERLGKRPIKTDFGQARVLLADFKQIPLDDWQLIRQQAGLDRRRLPDSRSKPAALWVWTESTLGDYLFSPNANQRNRLYELTNYHKFVRMILPELTDYLEPYRQRLLETTNDTSTP